MLCRCANALTSLAVSWQSRSQPSQADVRSRADSTKKRSYIEETALLAREHLLRPLAPALRITEFGRGLAIGVSREATMCIARNNTRCIPPPIKTQRTA